MSALRECPLLAADILAPAINVRFRGKSGHQAHIAIKSGPRARADREFAGDLQTAAKGAYLLAWTIF
jgi:hypothetical protein